MNTPTPVYVTHEEISFDDELGDGKNYLAQLKVGPHVVLEVPFYSDRYDADDHAATEIAGALWKFFKEKT